MRRAKFVIMYTVFFTVLLFSSSCYRPPLEGIVSVSHDAGTGDRATIADAPSDAQSLTKEDAGAASIDLKTRPSPDEEIVTVQLAPQTCHGARLQLSSELQQALSANMEVWHLCYKTPTTRTSTEALARFRPTQVITSLIFPHREVPLMRTEAPRVADPWTVSILVALPSRSMPLFNFVNRYANDEYLFAFEGPSLTFPLQNGEIQAWRVYADGSQVVATPHTACRNRDQMSEQLAGFVPDSGCLTGIDRCTPFSEMECFLF